jgi:subtilisin family serine protease
MPNYFIRTTSASDMDALEPAMAERPGAYRARTDPSVMVARLRREEVESLRDAGVEVIDSHQYEPLDVPFDLVYQPREQHPFTLRDVVAHTRADAAWARSRGAGVHIAVIDTGVCGTMAEFPAEKRSSHSIAMPGLGAAWTDVRGHGSMTACVAAATSAAGGRYDGVAPDATLISCKTTFDDTELYTIYDHLIALVDSGAVGQLVVSNAYGLTSCTPLAISLTDPFPAKVREAVARGIVCVFAAGNYHVAVCGNDPTSCGPTSIWGVNSMDDVISVGTIDRDERMDRRATEAGAYAHCDSSRGPGQFGTATTKPDCVAPTYGEVMWGCGYIALEWWGTSGAAPQVAGLAALLLARDPSLRPAQVRDIIMETCTPIGLAKTCAGSGLINCEAAVTRV